MPGMEPQERPGAETPGRLGKALMRLLTKRATVVASEPLADRFRLMTLEGPALRDVAWTAGQKVQIAMGSAFVTRTYTPIEWNRPAGRLCLLGYAHGDGPGSAWVRTARPGDECDIFGPRASLDPGRLPGPLVIVGDETSIGLACAATLQDRTRAVTSCLEVEDVESVRHVAADLDLPEVALFARRDGDAHLAAMEAALSEHAAAGASIVLTGKAGTIQRLRRSLKGRLLPSARLVTKAYWAVGKTGLD